MHYLVMIKQVPDDLTIYLDRESGLLRRSTAGVQTDPASRHALEHALQMRSSDDRITVLIKGPERATEALRQAMAMGCDAAVHLNDKVFEGSDLLSTARTLVAAIRRVKEPDIDVIVLGDRSADGRTGTLGPMIAEALGWQLIHHTEEAPPPRSVVIVPRDANAPRIPKPLQVMKASRQPITVWTHEDLGLEPSQTGLDGSATRVIRSEKATA